MDCRYWLSMGYAADNGRRIQCSRCWLRWFLLLIIEIMECWGPSRAINLNYGANGGAAHAHHERISGTWGQLLSRQRNPGSSGVWFDRRGSCKSPAPFEIPRRFYACTVSIRTSENGVMRFSQFMVNMPFDWLCMIMFTNEQNWQDLAYLKKTSMPSSSKAWSFCNLVFSFCLRRQRQKWASWTAYAWNVINAEAVWRQIQSSASRPELC